MTQTHMPPIWHIVPERADDVPRIDQLTEKCFGPGRFAKSAYRLREGVGPVADLSFVAVEGEHFYGSLRFWPVWVGCSYALLLGPLAVEPDLRGHGIGLALMHQGIQAAREKGYSCIILVGDEPYYVRVGFRRLPPGKVRFPGPVDPARVLGLSLQPNVLLTLSGEVRRAGISDPVCACGAGTGGGDFAGSGSDPGPGADIGTPAPIG